MENIVIVQVTQSGATSSVGSIRRHRVPIDRPGAKGGEDKGPMGGELLLAALGGCFMSTLLAAIRSREAEVADVRIEVGGTLVEAPQRFSKIDMAISADYRDEDLMHKLVTIAERSCIVANTLRDAVDLSVGLRGQVPSS